MVMENTEYKPTAESGPDWKTGEFEVDPSPEIIIDFEEIESVRREQARADRVAVEQTLGAIAAHTHEPSAQDVNAERVTTYQARSIPEYLKTPVDCVPFSARLLGIFAAAEGMKEAREALPKEGPFLVVANHSGGETPVLMSLLKDYDTHIAAGEELNFKRSGFREWLLKRMRMIPVRESLANLNTEEKQALLSRVPGAARKRSYGKIIEREESGNGPANNDFVRTAVGLMTRGDVVVMFPEGLFLYDGNKRLRKAYGGVEYIAREFKRVTGDDLPIVPVAVWDNNEGVQVDVGESFVFGDIRKRGSATDMVMRELAELVPEELQGPYEEK